ncbi:MAG: MarR family winged helix-turn-helix transcriptional regulator [Granulosicoccaceae bacterium]
MKAPKTYLLENQIGHILRKVSQRHSGIFVSQMSTELTPTRFAAMAKLLERGPLSQNELGRLTAMDVATIKGVVDRLRVRKLVDSKKDPKDARRQLIKLTNKGKTVMRAAIPDARRVTKLTLDPLTTAESKLLTKLLNKISI